MVDFFPQIAKDLGIKPYIIFWGALNYFGGGKSSQFLLDNPRAHQVQKDGSYNCAGCYNNQDAIFYIKQLIDLSVARGFQGYFIDEPSLLDCYCESCQELFKKSLDGDLHLASELQKFKFRQDCVTNYVKTITDYIRGKHLHIDTMCCVMPQDKVLWDSISELSGVDGLGTDIYWANEDNDVNGMVS